MRNGWQLLLVGGMCAAAAGCKGDDSCTDEIRVAVELHVMAPDDLMIEKVTAERASEEDCGLFFDPSVGRVYTCWEQGTGDGTYTIRFYSGGEVIYSEDDEVEADACHVKQRAVSEVKLGQQ